MQELTPQSLARSLRNRHERAVFARIASTGAALALLLASGGAFAQGKSPIQAAPPNVLLLVDTSGSMERMPDGTLPVCTPGVTGQEPNRWGSILQGLTGTVQPFWSCGVMRRDGAPAGANEQSLNAFRKAYWDSGLVGSVDSSEEYDVNYSLPHHRPLSGSTADSDVCGVFPNGSKGALPATFTNRVFDPSYLATYPWNSGNYSYPNGHANDYSNPAPAAGNICQFVQNDDGQLDTAASFARFGLMTFDSDSGAGIGKYLKLAGSPSTSTYQGGLASGAGLNVGGGWTFLYSNSDSAAAGDGLSLTGAVGNPATVFPLMGRFPGCTTDVQMAVGARNQYAPPWEGPFVKFPDPLMTRSQLAKHNENVQKAIAAVRPYGGTPIAGMMASAYDYLLRWGAANNQPSIAGEANSVPPRLDQYVQGGCRKQFVVLLTDGGPNLDLRDANCASSPSSGAEGTSFNTSSYCPFYKPDLTALRLRTEATSLIGAAASPIETFVIGFAVGHDSPGPALDGLPAPLTPRTCSAWRATFTSANAMAAACAGTPPAAGTTARACCDLNDIGVQGDEVSPAGNKRGAYFAESQSDLIGVFADILGQIAQQSSTRAVPAYAPSVTVASGASTITQSSTILASFRADPSQGVANANATSSANIWTGNLQRSRSICNSTGTTTEQAVAKASGDDFEYNLQRTTKERYFFTAVPEKVGGHIDGAESIRPYIGSLNDGVNDVGGVETVLTNADLSSTSGFRSALGLDAGETKDLFDIDKSTCKATTVKGNIKLPKVHEDDCARLMWGFASAAKPSNYPTAEAGYAVRCPIGSGPGQSTNLDDCKPLGSIIHSSPAVAGPPSALLRDEGYRKYADLYKNVYAPAGAPGGTYKQRQTLYVSTTDGLLHAFDVNFGGDASKPSELWAFLPPAVLPQLKTNFPGGQRNLLDGTPVVKDVVFDRGGADVGKHEPWHTVLVSGLGKDGYFALDVSSDGELAAASSYNPVTDGSLATLKSRLRSSAPVGPHFLWQLQSTIEAGGSEKGKHKGKKNKKGDKVYGLFGDKVGTPVITTLFFNDAAHTNSDNKPHEIGVAILPGGIDEDVPATGPSCARRTSPLPSYSAPNDVMNPRSSVRGWGANCGDAVAGRSVTIVRLDTGEIVRHFARATSSDDDVPKRLLDRGVCSGPNDNCRVINSPFDAPIVGTPVVFPNDVGSIAQKAFVGDADGTLYRLDLSSPDPSQWSAKLFLDTRGASFPDTGFTGDKPIAIPPVLSLAENGNLVLGVANGDQEDLSSKPAGDHNLLWSVTEIPAQSSVPVHPELNWYMNFTDGERVTGPMAVFDKTFYFATYKVSSTANVCQNGSANLYGRDYVKPYDTGNLSAGGDYRLVPVTAPFQSQGPDLIPGVSIRESQACATQVNTNDFFGGVRMGSQMTTPASFSLFANKAKNGGTNGNAVAQIKKDLQLPRTQTIVDSWASVVE